jgi:hypothetical protein
MKGFIRLHRQMLAWEWYKNPISSRVFIHLLLTANTKDTNCKGVTIKRGQTVTGRAFLSEALGLSVSNIRTALKNLENSKEIKVESNTRGTVITVLNFDKYQIDETEQKEVKTVKSVKSIEDRIYDFKKSLVPHLDKYGKTVLKNFSDYWTEKSPRGSKMRFEKEKVFDVSRRLATWSRNNFNNTNQPTQADDRRLQNIKKQLKK